MAAEHESQSYLELYDLAAKKKVVTTPLAEIRFIPRVGERVFISVKGPGDWNSYTVMAVEYFLGYEPGTGESARNLSSGIGKVTLFVEQSK